VSGDPAEGIRRRDEILQVLYWLRGEGLAETAGVAELRRFLDETAAADLAADLERLAAAGLLEPAADARYRLTDSGRQEGGRRFADEFADYVRQGHGACSDPECDCHALGPEACVH
jgi:hypothetical protein